MITDLQVERLPPLMREIVTVKRELKALVGPAVVPIGIGPRVRALQTRHAELLTAAAAQWGHVLKGEGGPANA